MKNNEIVNKLNALITVCNMTDTVKTDYLKKELEAIRDGLESGGRKDYGEFDLEAAKKAAKGLDLHLTMTNDGKHAVVTGEDSKKMVTVWHQLNGRFFFKDKSWSFRPEQAETLRKFIKG